MTRTNVPQKNSGDVHDSLLRLVADSVPALMAYYEVSTLTCQFANRRYADYIGWTTQSIVGKPLIEVIGEEAFAQIEPHVVQVVAGHTVRYVREQTLPDNSKRMIEVNLIPHFVDEGRQIGAFVLINDITDTWRAERAIRESELRMRRFAEASHEGIIFHKNGLITDANGALLELLGHSLDELLGHSILDYVAEPWRQTVKDYVRVEGEAPYEAEVVHRSGRLIPVEIVGRSMPHEGEIYRMAIVRDITARKQNQERIEYLALHDGLTQLPNRHYMMEHLTRLVSQAERKNARLALLFVDLDGFKAINDARGHQAGDVVLREMARRLQSSVRKADLVARFGGDEFLIALTDITSAEDAGRIAEHVLQAIRAPLGDKSQPYTVGASIGISLYPENGQTPVNLIAQADAAMYQAKDNGGGYRFYASDMAPHREGKDGRS